MALEFVFSCKENHRFREARGDIDLERDGTADVNSGINLEGPTIEECKKNTHTTRPSSIHPSTSIGMIFPLSLFPGSILQAHSIIAKSMKSELFETCFPTQTRLPKPYVT
jgi:hypothetical protein